MNRALFDLHVETQLVPTLPRGDVVRRGNDPPDHFLILLTLDNRAAHRSPTAAAAMQAVGVWFLFLPAYSPELNPIEMVFAKLKALIRRAAARTYDDLWRAVGHVCDLFTDEECYNVFKAAGYETN